MWLEALCSLPVHTEILKPLTTLVCSVKLQWADDIMAQSEVTKNVIAGKRLFKIETQNE
jgi:hypothetical protein